MFFLNSALANQSARPHHNNNREQLRSRRGPFPSNPLENIISRAALRGKITSQENLSQSRNGTTGIMITIDPAIIFIKNWLIVFARVAMPMPIRVNITEVVTTTKSRIQNQLSYPFGTISNIVLITIEISPSEIVLDQRYLLTGRGVTKRLCRTFCCFSSSSNAPINIIPKTEVSESTSNMLTNRRLSTGILNSIAR